MTLFSRLAIALGLLGVLACGASERASTATAESEKKAGQTDVAAPGAHEEEASEEEED